MNHKVYDIAILGGGCAGLSFAMAYTKTNLSHNIAIFEARDTYKHDRNWSFWLHKNDRSFQHTDIIKKTWASWQFSDKLLAAVHTANNYIYATIAAGDFYNKALKIINADKRLNLHLKSVVQAVTQDTSTGLFLIETTQEKILAQHVIDTRSIDHHAVEKSASFYQIFYGYEIETDDSCFNPNQVGLMENMTAQTTGLSFIYTLPFAANKALIEYTLFTPLFTQPANLEKNLIAAIKLKYPHLNYKITAKESSVLPMGKITSQQAVPQNNYIIFGANHSALRESSGYGFINIQNWAQTVVANLNAGRGLAYKPKRLLVTNFIDRHFIKTLIAYPEATTNIFMCMGQKMKADVFAQFMMGHLNLYNLLCVIYAAPKKLFMRALWK